MASPSTPRSTNQLDTLPLVASAVVLPTTVAPTVGHRTSSLRSAARPYSPIARSMATGRLITTGSIFHIQPSSFIPASAPVIHAVMLPIGRINLYVGFTGSSNPADPMPRSTPLGSHTYDGREYSFTTSTTSSWPTPTSSPAPHPARDRFNMPTWRTTRILPPR